MLVWLWLLTGMSKCRHVVMIAYQYEQVQACGYDGMVVVIHDVPQQLNHSAPQSTAALFPVLADHW